MPFKPAVASPFPASFDRCFHSRRWLPGTNRQRWSQQRDYSDYNRPSSPLVTATPFGIPRRLSSEQSKQHGELSAEVRRRLRSAAQIPALVTFLTQAGGSL